MKQTLSIALSAISLFSLSLTAVAQSEKQGIVPDKEISIGYQGVGPVVAGSVTISSLPKKAQDFIHRHFKNVSVEKCSQDFESMEYDIDLSDGVEVEFDRKGEWIEIDAGQSTTLNRDLVKRVLPRNVYRELEKRNVIGKVETLKRGSKGYKVELRGVEFDDYRFSHEGRLLSVND